MSSSESELDFEEVSSASGEQLYCSSSSFDEEDSDLEQNEIQGIEPYQFEPELPDDEPEDPEDDADADDLEHRRNNTDWCTCGECAIMDNIQNHRCCREEEKMEKKFQEIDQTLDPGVCFTTHPFFDAVCLNTAVLQTAYLQYRQQYNNPVLGDLASKYRHVAYRQVVRWCWGFLGRHNRVPLPSCVMLKIRATHPDVNSTYKGFRFPPLDDY